MRMELDLRPVAYVFIAAGIVLAGMSAVIPHFGAGHRLAFDVFVVGILPYAVYGALTEVLRGWSLLLPGTLFVPIHAWLTVSERYLAFDGFESGAIYIVPVVLTLIVLPLAILGGRFLNRKVSRSESSAPAPSSEEAQADWKT